MQRTKRDDQRRVNRWVFAAVWASVLFLIRWVLGPVINAAFDTAFKVSYDSHLQIIPETIIDLLVGWVQIWLVRRWLKHSLRGWRVALIAGSVIAWAIIAFVEAVLADPWQLRENPYPYAFFRYVMSAAPIAFFQWIVLANRVQRAWLWPLMLISISIVSFGISAFLSQSGVFDTPRFEILGLNIALFAFFNFSSGLLMHYLMSHLSARETARLEVAAEASRLRQLRMIEMHRVNETVISRVYGEDHAAS